MRADKGNAMLRTLPALWAAVLLCAGALAQTLPPPSDPPETEKGETRDGYEIHQSVEFGGYFADVDGNESLWDTYVNQHSGPRLLGFTLDMHSVDHSNLLFDELHASSFGYGGDPNNWSRLRASKARVYDFSASFRRDRNYFDYNLLANPLNPATSVPNVPVEVSPHRFQTVRRMTDINLTVLPLAPVRLRFGYARNVSEGPSDWTVHEGTEARITQMWRNGLDTYRAGIDFRLLPRTTFSYDQIISVYKGDTFWIDPPPDGTFELSPGVPVDLGIVFNTLASQPCNPALIGGFVNPACNAYYDASGLPGYTRFSPTRNVYPTEQASFQSNYFKKFDLSGRFNYTASDSDVPVFLEFFRGFASRTRTRQLTGAGPASSRRVNASADFGLTFHFAEHWAFVDTFRWTNFRVPGRFEQVQFALFAANLATTPNEFDPLTCPGTPATCPQHGPSSGPDVILADRNHFLGQDTKMNTAELEYGYGRRFGARIGYRVRHRDIALSVFDLYTLTFFPTSPNRGACVGQPLNPDGSCTVTTLNGTGAANVVAGPAGLEPESEQLHINEHSFLFGLWLRPVDYFSLTYDMELMSADGAFTRISPRHLQQYRVRVRFQPVNWINVSGNVAIRENRNNEETIDNLQHNRVYSLAATVMPRESVGFDFSYSYQDVFSHTNICFVSTPSPPGTEDCGAPFLEDISVYDQKVHFLSGSVLFKPLKRVTVQAGYTGTFAEGATLILNPIAPLGPLTYQYHLPTAGVRVQLAPRWSVAGGWNHYGYNEDGDSGPTAPREFRGNVGTVGVRYAF